MPVVRKYYVHAIKMSFLKMEVFQLSCLDSGASNIHICNVCVIQELSKSPIAGLSYAALCSVLQFATDAILMNVNKNNYLKSITRASNQVVGSSNLSGRAKPLI